MTDAPALLPLLTENSAVARYLAWPCNFDPQRAVYGHVEPVRLPGGARLEPVAGSDTGGTYFLVGDGPADERPVLYADSEGGCGLMARSLRGALVIAVGLPFWENGCRGGGRIEEAWIAEAESDLLEDHPELFADRDAVAAALGLEIPPRAALLDRLRAALARTAPDYLLHGAYDGEPYRVL